MIHLRIIAPPDRAEQAVELMKACPGATNLIYLPGAAHEPEGDVILVDVVREEASLIIGDLRELDIPVEGSIALEEVDSAISTAADQAERDSVGVPSDAVIWEEVESRTSETTELSFTFLAFMIVACLIAAVGIVLDQTILIVGAMVVGPEFGPIAGTCVAAVQRRPALAGRSLAALALGFPVGITGAWLATLAFRAMDVAPQALDLDTHQLADLVSSPDFFTFFIAFFAGIAGMLSLTAAKSGALIGVLISVTTIPAAASIGVAFAYQDWSVWRGSQALLAINLASIVAAGILTLTVQKLVYLRRRRDHVELDVRRIRRRERRASSVAADETARRDRGHG